MDSQDIIEGIEMHQETHKMNYEIGDPCWVFTNQFDDNKQPILIKGAVVNKFSLSHHPNEYYVIELLDPYWMHLEVRDALLMSDRPDGNIAVWSQEMIVIEEETEIEANEKPNIMGTE